MPSETKTKMFKKHLLAAKNFLPVKTEIMSRFVKFYSSLLKSPSLEVQMMAKSVINDKRSVTAKNLEHIKDVTGLDNSNFTANDVRNYSGVTPVPINQ